MSFGSGSCNQVPLTAPTPGRQCGLGDAVARLYTIQQETSKLVDLLEDRLKSLSVSPVPSPGMEVGGQTGVQANSPMVLAVREVSSGFDVIKGRLSDLINILDI